MQACCPMMSNLLEEVRLLTQLPFPNEARALRERARVSRRRLARELGVHECTIARWEEGESRPRAQVAVRYAEILEALEKASA
jgi:transcriptional regulator with XRE-family HTH domain